MNDNEAESEEIFLTEYDRGVREGINQREALAREVMEWTASVERLDIILKAENQRLRYQRNSFVFIAVCMFVAFISAYMR